MGAINGHPQEQEPEPRNVLRRQAPNVQQEDDFEFDMEFELNAMLFRALNRRVRGRRHRRRGPRRIYTNRQRRRAIQWLDAGIPSREVADLMGPRCSAATPIRWRQQDLARREAKQERARQRLLARQLPPPAWTVD